MKEYFYDYNNRARVEKFINQQVNFGVYNSTSEALDYAYRLMREREFIRKQRILELNSEISKGLDYSDANLISNQDLQIHIKNRRENFSE